MKRFVEFIAEEPKKQEEIPVIHVHYRSGGDPKHDIDSKETTEILIHAHYRSGKDPKHDIENENPIKENFAFNKKGQLKGTLNQKGQIRFTAQFKHQHAHLKNQLEEHHRPGFINIFRDSIAEYTQSSSRLNNALHKDEPLSLRQKQQVDKLDQFTNHPKNSLKKDLKVYSGISTKFGEAIHKLKPGQHVSTKAYMSTTGDPDIAFNFAINRSRSAGSFNRHVLQIHLPKGYTKARHIPDTVGDYALHENPGESEVLLARDQKFKKIKTRIEKSAAGHKWHIHHLEPVD